MLEAKALYRQIAGLAPQARRADLQAASQACRCKLDFADLLDKAEHYFG